MAPNAAYSDDAEDIPADIAAEIDDNRRAWANCHRALVKLRPHMVGPGASRIRWTHRPAPRWLLQRWTEG